MGEYSFPKAFHLRRAGDFHQVYASGVKKHTRGFIIFRRPNELEHPRLGLSVSRKYGSAVRRNRIKRLIREAVRLHWQRWNLEGSDIVIITKRSSAGFGFQDVREDFSRFFSRRPEVH